MVCLGMLRPKATAWMAVLTVAGSALTHGVAAADPAQVRVMTLNMNEGTDFLEVTAAKTLPDFLAAVTLTYNNILATKPAERAVAMAKEIATGKPQLIGLQEASILRTGTPATTVVFDLPQLLLQELSKLGENYTVAATFSRLDVEAPSTLGFDVRLTSQEVILVRTEPQHQLSYSNMQVHPYAAQLPLDIPGVGSVSLTRGWASIDVVVKGQPFRFVTTHLETEAALLIQTAQATELVQTAQATELVQTAGNTSLPIIYAGDFNTPANDPSSLAFPTYQVMLATGVQDVWPVANPSDPGLTCCQAQNDRNPVSQLSERSDLIFVSSVFQVERAKLVGQRSRDRTKSGLWPSDHAGVIASLCLDASNSEMSCTGDTLADTQ